MEIVGYQEKYGGEVIELWYKCKLVVPYPNIIPAEILKEK